MDAVQIEQKSYEMPPREGISIAHFLTVADVERSARYYEKVFGARILSLGDGNAPGYLQLANIWMILNVGGGPTPDKPTVTLSVPDPSHINSFMNFRVADIQACYKLWKSRGAEFITPPIPKYYPDVVRCQPLYETRQALESASHPGRELAVGLIRALSHFDNVAVKIADVAANLAVFRNRLRDELSASTLP